MSFVDGSPASIDHMLPAVTVEAVASALAGFAVPLLPCRKMDWLAMAVRRSLTICMADPSGDEKRTSNADIRAELERLATLVGSTWLQLFQCDLAANSRLWDHALHHSPGEVGKDVGGIMMVGEPSDYRRFEAAVQELDWTASFLRETAKTIASQHGQWRQSEKRRLRVERGQYLAPIYEAAFGEPVSANNYPSGTHREPSAFMYFYQQMVWLAFGEVSTPNISYVLKAACGLHRQCPVKFAENIIPGL